MVAEHDVTEEVRLTTHQHDFDRLAAGLLPWLRGALEADGPVRVENVRRPSGSGMSSVTLLLDAAWTHGGRPRRRSLAVRLAPDGESFPVFPRYDLRRQHDVLAAVRERTDVPVPALVGLEDTGTVLGTPYLVMEAVDGVAPTDNPPYVFGGWLFDATPEQRALLQARTLGLLARIHALPDPGSVLAPVAGDALRAHVDATRGYYDWTHARDGVRVPLLERAFGWLEDHWPDDVGEPVLSWGDARPGNVLYRDFEPRAVLDWEMAALAPPEVDLGWYVFIHCFFQDIAEAFGLPGLPDFARADEVVACYERVGGARVRDLEWYVVYAAVRHGVVMAQIKRRMVHFGEEQAPAEPDDFVMHRAALERLLDGSYPWRGR